MFDLIVKKVIARDGEREIVPSSVEEMHTFVVEEMRPEFEDPHTLCVKFIQTYDEEANEFEEGYWYINPKVCPVASGQEKLLSYCHSAYGPKMDAAFVPEILLVSFEEPDVVLKKYAEFNVGLVLNNQTHLSDEEKYNLFLEQYNDLM